MRRVNQSTTILFFILAILFISAIPLLRYVGGNNYVPGEETYSVLEDAQEPQTLYDFLIHGLILILTPFLLTIIFPLVLAMGSLMLIVALLRQMVSSSYEYYYALAVIILTPLFLIVHIGLHLHAIVFFFSLLTAYLYLQRNSFYLLTLGTLFAFDAFIGILGALILFGVEWIHGEKRKAFVILLAIVLINFLTWFFAISNPFLPLHLISLNSLFMFFGGEYGYSFFLLILGITGMFMAVEFTTTTTRIIQVLILGLSIVYEPLRLLGLVLLAAYAGIALHQFMTRKWSNEFLFQLTIILLFCILIFSTSTFMKETYNDSPTIEEIQGLEHIAFHGGDTIFLHPNTASFAKYFTGLNVYEDDTLAQSKSYKFVKEKFIENNISYVFVDKALYSEWYRSEEGLLFVMQHNDDFILEYDQGVLIYAYNPT